MDADAYVIKKLKAFALDNGLEFSYWVSNRGSRLVTQFVNPEEKRGWTEIVSRTKMLKLSTRSKALGSIVNGIKESVNENLSLKIK